MNNHDFYVALAKMVNNVLDSFSTLVDLPTQDYREEYVSAATLDFAFYIRELVKLNPEWDMAEIVRIRQEEERKAEMEAET